MLYHIKLYVKNLALLDMNILRVSNFKLKL